ncbi:MAG TPA: ABC transporter substrate-binding protein, partial [Burkholderiaceae bacterium]
MNNLIAVPRRLALVALALGAGLACAAHAETPPAQFKIGGVVSLSGTYGIYGVDMQKGVALAIEQHGGKVLGKPIEVMWEDDETKPQPAVQKATRLIASGADMIFGAVSSTSTLAIMNLAKQRKIPHLVTTSADDKITQPGGSRYTFRTGNSFGLETRMAFNFTQARKLTRIYGVIADYGATRDGWQWYRAEAEKAGIKIVGEDFAPLGNRDYASIVNNIANSDADGVAVFTSGSDSVTLLKQAAAVNLNRNRVVFGPGLIDDALATATGPGVVGVYSGVRSHFSLDNAANKAFV